MSHPITRLEAVRNLLIVGGIIAIALIWHYLHDERTVCAYVNRHLRKLYFCGYSLERLIRENFASNLERYLGFELPGLYAVLMMLAMRHNHTARIIRGKFNDAGYDYWHSWLEFRFFDSWYAIDPGWYECLTLSKSEFRSSNPDRDEQVQNYKEFWSIAAARQFYERMCQPETSYTFYELFVSIKDCRLVGWEQPLDSSVGESFVPIWFRDLLIVTEDIVNYIVEQHTYEIPSSLVNAAINEECRYRTQRPRKEIS